MDVETAKQVGRTGFREMLAFLRADARCQTVLVEKTDRLYRNIRDWVTVDEFTLTVHFVKENAVISKDSRSSEKFLHGIKVLMAKNYVDNLSEEVKKGLREKAEQGHWPSAAPVGYVNNLATHRIEVDPVRGSLIRALFEVYATASTPCKRWPPKPGRSASPIRDQDARCSRPKSIASCRIRSTWAISAGWTRCTGLPRATRSPRTV